MKPCDEHRGWRTAAKVRVGDEISTGLPGRWSAAPCECDDSEIFIFNSDKEITGEPMAFKPGVETTERDGEKEGSGLIDCKHLIGKCLCGKISIGCSPPQINRLEISCVLLDHKFSCASQEKEKEEMNKGVRTIPYKDIPITVCKCNNCASFKTSEQAKEKEEMAKTIIDERQDPTFENTPEEEVERLNQKVSDGLALIQGQREKIAALEKEAQINARLRQEITALKGAVADFWVENKEKDAEIAKLRAEKALSIAKGENHEAN